MHKESYAGGGSRGPTAISHVVLSDVLALTAILLALLMLGGKQSIRESRKVTVVNSVQSSSPPDGNVSNDQPRASRFFRWRKARLTQDERPEDSLNAMLEDAREHIRYLIESGRVVTPDEAKEIQLIVDALNQRDAPKVGSVVLSGELLTALANLSSRVRPVTAETLRLCSTSTRNVLRHYWKGTFILAFVILVFSLLSFLTLGVAKSMGTGIDNANALAVRLVSQIGGLNDGSAIAPPGGASSTGPATAPRIVLADLQAFAAATRSIYQQATLLNGLNVLKADNPHFAKDDLQLTVPLNDPPGTAGMMIRRYQDVRTFATTVHGYTELFYGAIGTIILPILYALLGACAYLLRLFSSQVRERSYLPSYADYAHLLVAGIGGAVIGLFNGFAVGGGVSLSPLAIAFLVGYAADAFFTFLDNIVQPKGRSNANGKDMTSVTTSK